MNGGGDYDDAVNVIDIWLHEHPETAPWDRDDFELPFDLDFDVDRFLARENREKASRYAYV